MNRVLRDSFRILMLILLTPLGSSAVMLPDQPCPHIAIRCAEKRCGGKKQKFAVDLSGADPNLKYSFKWCASAGKIVGGQGTSMIEIDAGETGDDVITVVVIVGGLHKLCDNVASHSMELAHGVSGGAATPNNGMHPTPNQQSSYHSRQQGAGDAGR